MMNLDEALGIVRLMINNGVARQIAIDTPAIPKELRKQINDILRQEENITLEPARMLVAMPRRSDWLRKIDRSNWYYWPNLRVLFRCKGFLFANGSFP